VTRTDADADADADADLDTFEGLDGYVPPPYVPPATLDERLLAAWRLITRTPGRAALATLDVCAGVAFVIALRPIPVTTVDASGPLHAHCGISFYVGGSSNRAVESACRYAYASRIPVLVLLGLIVGASTLLLVRAVTHPAPSDGESGWRRLWNEVTQTPARAALATFDVAALLGVIAAAQPVTVASSDRTGFMRAHCGLGYYLFGVGDAAVRTACRRAYSSHAAVFFVLLAALVVGTGALVRLVRPRRR
jgi:hypothetical protein